MDRIVDSGINLLNNAGQPFCTHTGSAFIQSSVLIVVFLVLDLLLRKRVRAVVRYSVWLLVFVKLLLPPTLSLPTGIGYYWPPSVAVHQKMVAEETISTVPATLVRSQPIPRTAPSEDVIEVSDAVAGPVSAVLPPTSLASVRPTVAWQGAVFLGWLAGVVLLGICVARRVRYVGKLVRASTPAPNSLQEILAQCAAKLGLRRCPQLRLSDDAPGPVVCRLLSPVVLLPMTLADKMSEDRLRTVLVHELAHIKRADLWVNFVQTLLLVAYFYHPLLWLVNAIVRRLREQAVDETVLVALDAEAKGYSTTLIDLAEMTFKRPILGLRLIGIAESKKALEGRIRHMMTRPKPKTARVGLWGLVAIAVGAAVLLPMAAARNKSDLRSDPGGDKFLLLDDKDSTPKGKDHYDDRLYLIDSDGTIEAALSGFNVYGSFGGAHMLAIDSVRRVLWVVENAGGRLSQFDLTTGELIRKVPDLRASAVAVDASTGNAWVTTTEGIIGKGHVQVISPSGQTLARHDVAGFDIAYSAYDQSFWVVGKDVYRLDSHGNVLGRITGEIPWTAVSVCVDERAGNAWIVVRDHPNIAESRPELWCVDGSVEVQQRIDLGDLMPFCVAVDSENETVWVGCLGVTLRYATQGEKLTSARHVSGFSIVPGSSANSVVAASMWGVGVARVEDSGLVVSGDLSDRMEVQLASSQKWLARVPFAGAKLQSSPELADLSRRPPNPADVAPVSAAKLKALGMALLMYANDYEDKFPDTLQEVRAFVGDEDVAWLTQNVAYLGKGKTTSDHPDVVVAYDKTLLAKGDGTLVLFLASHIEYMALRELEALGIKPVPKSAEEAEVRARVTVLGNLKRLAQAAIMYAEEHDDTFADGLKVFEPYVRNDTLFAWASENVTYVGNGVKATGGPEASNKPLAYCRPGFAAPDEVAVAFQDGHVEFVKGPRLKKLGIAIEP